MSALDERPTGWRYATGWRRAPAHGADARRNYQALLSAASAAFIEQGADDASLEEIAGGGVGIGTLYRHFPHPAGPAGGGLPGSGGVISARAEELLATRAARRGAGAWLRALVEFGSTTQPDLGILATLDRIPSSCRPAVA